MYKQKMFKVQRGNIKGELTQPGTGGGSESAGLRGVYERREG